MKASSSAERGAVPPHPQQRGVPHHVDVVAVGREAGDGRLGHDQAGDDRQVDRVEHEQLGRLSRLDGLTGALAGEVLGDEVAVGQHDEAVVGPRPRQRRPRRATSSVGLSRWAWLPNTTCSEPSAWQARPPGHIGPGGEHRRRAHHLERHGVDLLHPGLHLGAEPVAQHVDLAGVAQHDHRRARRLPVRDDELAARRASPSPRCGRRRHLQPPGAAVLGRPRARAQ